MPTITITVVDSTGAAEVSACIAIIGGGEIGLHAQIDQPISALVRAGRWKRAIRRARPLALALLCLAA
jgi:ribosomal protein L14